jgi:FixJ family two-component response regulator
MLSRSLVVIVDDDVSVRESLPPLLHELGFDALSFASAEEFLTSGFLDETRCLLLDIAMPGMNGPALQRELARQRRSIPIIFITADGDERIRPRMLAAGAVECLLKPFSEFTLLEAVTLALRAA